MLTLRNSICIYQFDLILNKKFNKIPAFFFQLSGAACTALGVYILVSDYGPRELSGVLGNELYHIAAYVAIAGGAAIAIISLCGCVGATKESKIILALVSIK